MLVQSCHACSHIFPNPCHFLIVSTDKMEHLENGTSIFIVLLLVLPSRNWPMPSPRQVHLTMDVIKCYKICKCQKPNSNKRQEGVCVCVCVRQRERERERETKQQFESTAAQPVAVQVYFSHHQPTNLKYHSWSAQFQGVCKKHLHSKKL
jgi:hypothetical protein